VLAGIIHIYLKKEKEKKDENQNSLPSLSFPWQTSGVKPDYSVLNSPRACSADAVLLVCDKPRDGSQSNGAAIKQALEAPHTRN